MAESNSRTRILLVGIAALLVAGLSGYAAGTLAGWWRGYRPDVRRFPEWGVDVSRHQGHIDWPEVAREPQVRFAYLKATEGGDWVDPTFARNWIEARRAGLSVGAYHFFTFCRPAADQARNFLATLPREKPMLPPALDLEFGGNCRIQLDGGAIQASVRTWMNLVEAELGVRPVLYVTQEAYDAFVKDGGLDGYPLWIRSLFREPSLDEGRSWVFWQWHNRARVRGVEGPVDLNARAPAS